MFSVSSHGRTRSSIYSFITYKKRGERKSVMQVTELRAGWERRGGLVRGSTRTSFLSFSKKGGTRRGGRRGSNIYIHSFFSHGPLDSSTQTCANRRRKREERPLHPEYLGARELSDCTQRSFARTNLAARARKHNQTRRVRRRGRS